jgi:hypothetical protein
MEKTNKSDFSRFFKITMALFEFDFNRLESRKSQLKSDFFSFFLTQVANGHLAAKLDRSSSFRAL